MIKLTRENCLNFLMFDLVTTTIWIMDSVSNFKHGVSIFNIYFDIVMTGLGIIATYGAYTKVKENSTEININ